MKDFHVKARKIKHNAIGLNDMLKSGHKVQVERERERVCVSYTGGVAAHGILSIRLKALNLLIYPPVAGADQARLWLTARKERTERQDGRK